MAVDTPTSRTNWLSYYNLLVSNCIKSNLFCGICELLYAFVFFCLVVCDIGLDQIFLLKNALFSTMFCK